MPELINQRYEAFALHRGNGLSLEEAYRAAGFRPDKGHPSRLAARPEVAERIAELQRRNQQINWADRPTVISALLGVAMECQRSRDVAGYREARLAFLDASRLFQEHAAAQPAEGEGPPAEPPKVGAAYRWR